MGLGMSGKALSNLTSHWHSLERRFGNDEMEFGKLEGNFGRQEVEFDNWEGDY